MTFRDLGIDQDIADALAAKGITEPFPIQEQAIPVALTGQDVIGQAKTGTGKTFGFGLPLIQILGPNPEPGAKAMVLDEADEMLDLGFLPDVERLFAYTPDGRQTMLFSATMPGAIVTMARKYQNKPVHIRANEPDEGHTKADIKQFIYRAHALDKDEVVGRILQAEGRGKTVIFCKTKRQASKVAEELVDRGFNATALHGDMSQEAREKSMAAFRSGKRDILVATEVAARGIDVDDVTHVINYTVPEDEKALLHRVGRTGRAGRTGIAVTFVDWEDLTRWKHINDALQFGQPEPTETYSSSAHLFEDLNIAPGTKGRVRASTAQPKSAGSSDRAGNGRGGSGGGRGGRGSERGGSGRTGSGKSGSGKSGSGEKKAATEQPRAPRSDRQRTRTRRTSGH